MEWVLKLTHPVLLYANPSWSVQFIVFSLIHIILSFVLLGICASDYLCPNVTNIVELKQKSSSRHSAISASSSIIKVSSNASSGIIMAVLLSWCNSSPDLFSNFLSWTSATKDNLTVISLSIGEVLGACGIILCIVQGTIIIIMSSIDLQMIPVQKYSIFKDLIMVLIAMLLMTYIILQNKVTIMNCLLMLFIYSFYIYSKFSHHFSKRKHIDNDTISDSNIVGNSFDGNDISNFSNVNSNSNADHIGFNENAIDNEFYLQARTPDLENISSYFEGEYDNVDFTTGIKKNLISAMDFNNLLNILENSPLSSTNVANSEHEMINFNSSSSIILDTNNNHLLPHDRQRALSEPIYYHVNSLNIDSNNVFNHNSQRNGLNSAPMTFKSYHHDADLVETEAHQLNELPYVESVSLHNYLKRNRKYRNLLCQILTPHLLNFKKKSKIDATLSLLTTPFVLILQLSCPRLIDILEFDESTTYYSLPVIKSITLWAQSLISPMMTMTLIACLCSWPKIHIILWIVTILIILGLIALLAHFQRQLYLHNQFSLLTTSNSMEDIEAKNKERRNLEKLQTVLNIIFLSIGIVNSILFISLIANTLIELMELYQKLTGISKAILGLTIFAWGNSLSDLLTNIAMCRLYLKVPNKDHIEMIATKFFVISFQSCLGGVMLNSMIGIGLSGLITMFWLQSGNTNWWFLRYIKFQESLNDSSENAGINYQFVVCCITILIQNLLLLNLIGGAKLWDRLSKRELRLVGIFMCGLWGVATFINVCLEVLNQTQSISS